MFALPLRVGAICGGAFALTSNRAGLLPAKDLAQAWVSAEFALRLVLDEQAGINFQDSYPALDTGFDNRPEIHQATGMISVQLGIGIEETFSRLRARAFAQERPLSELAADVVTRRLRFDPEDTA